MVVPPLYRKTHIPLVFLSQYGVRLLLFETRFRFFRFQTFMFHFVFCASISVRRFGSTVVRGYTSGTCYIVVVTSWLSWNPVVMLISSMRILLVGL